MILFLKVIPMTNVQATNYTSPVIDNSQFTGLSISVRTSSINNGTTINPSKYNLTVVLFDSTGGSQVLYNTTSVTYAKGHASYQIVIHSIDHFCVEIIPSRISFQGECSTHAEASLLAISQENTTTSPVTSPIGLYLPLVAMLIFGLARKSTK